MIEKRPFCGVRTHFYDDDSTHDRIVTPAAGKHFAAKKHPVNVVLCFNFTIRAV